MKMLQIALPISPKHDSDEDNEDDLSDMEEDALTPPSGTEIQEPDKEDEMQPSRLKPPGLNLGSLAVPTGDMAVKRVLTTPEIEAEEEKFGYFPEMAPLPTFDKSDSKKGGGLFAGMETITFGVCFCRRIRINF